MRPVYSANSSLVSTYRLETTLNRWNSNWILREVSRMLWRLGGRVEPAGFGMGRDASGGGMPCEQGIGNDGSLWGLANERGLEAFERKDYDLAIAEFNEAIRLKPDDGAAYFNLAVLYSSRGEREKVIVQYSEAIRLKPYDFLLYYCRGIAYDQVGDYDRAIADYHRAILLRTDNEVAFINRGLDYDRTGDHDKAVADYNEAIRLRPMRAYNGIAWVLAVCADPNIRNGAKAVEYATKACELSGGKFPSFFSTLAAAYAEAGDFDNAVKWQTKYCVESNLSGDNLENARQRLSLYEQKKPYRVEKPSPFGE